MKYCTNCGTQLDSDSSYCTNCGSKNSPNMSDITTPKVSSGLIGPSSNLHAYVPFQDRYQLDKRTAELKIVLILEYFLLTNVILVSLLVLGAVPGLGLVLLGVSGIYFWLIYSLQQFNNIARIIIIILLIIGLIVSIIGFNIDGIAFCIFQIYALRFHKRTMDSFTKNGKKNITTTNIA